MLKPEFIQGLKKNNVSKDTEKTKERLRAVWKPLAKISRDEILSLSGLKRTTIERAYTIGAVSARVIAAFAHVLEIDPYYLAGISDESRPFEQDYVSRFLSELGYKPGKKDMVKQGKGNQKPNTPTQAAPAPKPLETTKSPAASAATEKVKEATPATTGLDALSSAVSGLLDNDAQGKIDGLTEEDIVLMLRSLSVQAGFSVHKKERLALIKQLLLA